MNIVSFRSDPRQGNLDRCKRVVSYLAKFKWDAIRIRTEEPNLSSMLTTPRDWEDSFYGKVKELTPHDTPVPLGKYVVTISYHNAIFHDVITGRSVTGGLHILSKTPIDLHSKKQSTIETETCGSE